LLSYQQEVVGATSYLACPVYIEDQPLAGMLYGDYTVGDSLSGRAWFEVLISWTVMAVCLFLVSNIF